MARRGNPQGEIGGIRCHRRIGLRTDRIRAGGRRGHRDAPGSTVDSINIVDPVDIVDADGHAHREYAVTEPTLFLIRPDGHIGVIADIAHGAAVLDYLANLGKN